jgi:hypothetical protein
MGPEARDALVTRPLGDDLLLPRLLREDGVAHLPRPVERGMPRLATLVREELMDGRDAGSGTHLWILLSGW